MTSIHVRRSLAKYIYSTYALHIYSFGRFDRGNNPSPRHEQRTTLRLKLNRRTKTYDSLLCLCLLVLYTFPKLCIREYQVKGGFLYIILAIIFLIASQIAYRSYMYIARVPGHALGNSCNQRIISNRRLTIHEVFK